jgi:hypothetical protein
MESSRRVLLSRGAVVFGVVNVLRLIPELFVLRKDAIGAYTVLAACDLLLSVVTIAAGVGLIKGRPWAPTALAYSAAAGFIISLVMFIFMWPYMRSPSGNDFKFFPRFAFYGLVILAFPIAAAALIRRRRELVGSLIWGAISGGACVAVFFLVRH